MRSLVVVVLAALVAAASAATPLRAERCEPDRWVLRGGLSLVAGGGVSPGPVLALDGSHAALDSGCGPTRLRRRATRKGTVLTARWRRCGSRRAVVVRALVPPDGGCETFEGTMRARGVSPRPFRAVRSTCGDGIVDGGKGERCEAADACAPGLVCNTCACVPPVVSPTTTSTSTTLVPPSAACGNGVREAGEACDGPDLDGFVCPEGGTATCAAGCGAVDARGCFRCGDDVLEGDETCDDGNRADGDGCAGFCRVEDAFAGGSEGDSGTIDACVLVWWVWGLAPAAANVCTDGAACDRDGAADGACLFRAGVCANESQSPQAGPIACRPADVAGVALAGGAILDAMQEDAVVGALGRLLTGDGGAVSRTGTALAVTPPYAARGGCDQFDLAVAAGSAAVVAVTGVTAGGSVDVDRLDFACMP